MLRAARLSTGTRAPKIALLTAFALTALALSAAPALAAPATPTLTVETLLPGGPTPAGSATLHGVLSPGVSGEPGSLYQFHYKEFKEGETPDCEGGLASPESPGIAVGEENEAVTETLPNLTPGSKYAVCLQVENLSSETATSAVETFTTAITPEQPVAREVQNITGSTAELRAELNRLKPGEPGSYQFRYGQNGECSTPGEVKASLGAEHEIVTDPVEGLEPNRLYTYCVTATNEAGEPSESTPATFRTAAPAPAVLSETPTVYSPFEARVEAAVNAENQTATCFVEYGPTTSYGTRVPCEQSTIEGGNSNVGLSLSGLTAGTVYHYRFVLENPEHEQGIGAAEFTTDPLLAATIEGASATAVGAVSATLQAQINPGYQSTEYTFEYSSEEAGGKLSGTIKTLHGAPSLTGGEAQTASVHTGPVLKAGTTYYYRATAENATAPIAEEPVRSFTTPPAATTSAVTAITATTATFHGSLTPLNETVATKYHFSYRVGAQCTGEGAQSSPEVEIEAGKGTGEETAETPVTGLQPDAGYSVCLVTTNASGEQNGNAVTFTTPAGPPAVTEEATPAEGSTLTPYEAKLEAQIDPDGQATNYTFEYATGETGGALSGTVVKLPGAAALPAAITAQTASAETGRHLEPATTYYYRVVASNASPGTAEGAVQSFKTPAAATPTVSGESSAEPTATTVHLEASIFPSYQASTVHFLYAPSEAEILAGEGTTIPAADVPEGSIAEGFPAATDTVTVQGLTPNRTYYYRAIAENPTGADTPSPAVQRFATTSEPAVTTAAAEDVTTTTATAPGTVNPEGAYTTYHVQYGGTTDYASQTPNLAAGSGTTAVPVTVALESLEPGRTYHFRLVAENITDGTTYTGYGEDRTLTTPSTPPVITGLASGSVGQTVATITATLNPQGLTTRWELLAGSNQHALQAVTSGQASSETQLSVPVGNLTPGTVYFYRLTAANADGTVEPEGAFTTLPGPAPAGQPGLPALIPYVPVSTITAQQEAENKKNGKPKTLTNKQKLAKALTACHKDKKKSKRAKCERAAHKKYPVKASKSATRKS